jgi:hypothetical protein
LSEEYRADLGRERDHAVANRFAALRVVVSSSARKKNMEHNARAWLVRVADDS